MAIGVKLGTDHEEKRFLAGVLMYHLSQLLERNLRDHVVEKIKKAGEQGYGYDEWQVREDKDRMSRLKQLRVKSVSMLGGEYMQDSLSADELETVCQTLGAFDFVREVMESRPPYVSDVSE